MKTLLIAGFILLMNVASAIAQPFPFQRQLGLGKDRENLTPEQIETRAEALRKASEFWLLRMNDAKEAPNRIFGEDLWSIIQVSAAEHNVDPYVLAALIFVESFGRADAVSPTGPRGILQFTLAKAEEVGLKMRYEKRKVQTGTKRVGRGKKRRSVPVFKFRNVLVQDDRLIPALAIPAGARSLAASYRIYGRWDFAIQEHHNGNGRVRTMVATYLGLPKGDVTNKTVGELIAKHNLTYPQVFFDNTPYHRAALYEYLDRIRREADYAPTYSFRVLQAADLLKMYEGNSSAYEARFASYRSRFKDNGVAPNRMWYFYDPDEFKELQFANLVAIKENKDGRLVRLPEPWTAYGYDVRLHGASRIAEKDPENQQDYIQAEAGTVGALIAIMHEVKLLQGNRFEPYEINSLVRTSETQEDLLDDPGTKASRALPTHTLGKAFDFPVRGLKVERLNDLLFILSDMDSNGMISYVGEYQTEQVCTKKRKRKGKLICTRSFTRKSLATLHVVPHPQWEAYFNVVYRQATGKTEELTTNTQ